MAKPELGTKRQCQHCGAKFFDFSKTPIICPKCGTVFVGAARTRVASKEDEAEVEMVAPAGVDIVSLDEVEAAEEKTAETTADDIDGVDDEADDAEDNSFLEEAEEDDDDVTNLIDGDIAPDEEG